MQSVKHHVLLALLTACFATISAGYAAEIKQKDTAEPKPAKAQSKPDAKQKNVAVVNGVGIPQSRLDFVAKSQLAQAQQQQGQPGQQPLQDSPEFRDNLREILITREILYQEAVRRKLDKNPDYHSQLDQANHQIILEVLIHNHSNKLMTSVNYEC